MAANELYELIAERSMSRVFQNYFERLSEDQQIMVGLELMALRTWAVSHAVHREITDGAEENRLINHIENKLQQDCSENIFQFLIMRVSMYNGLSQLSKPFEFIGSQFQSNIQEINPMLGNVPDNDVIEMIQLFFEEAKDIINKKDVKPEAAKGWPFNLFKK